MTDSTALRDPRPRVPSLRDRVELIAGISGLALVVIGGILIRSVAHGAPLGVDAAWAQLMTSGRTPTGVTLATTLALIGGGAVTAIVTVLVALVLLVLRRWQVASVLVAAMAVSSGASSILKIAVGRPRPAGGLMRLTSFSYPSGHATTAAVFAAVLILALPRLWTWVVGVGWVVVIAWSRNYLGVHWLTDVAAGVLLGASVSLFVNGLARVAARSAASARRRRASGPAQPTA